MHAQSFAVLTLQRERPNSLGRASDRHAADVGSIPRCGKVFFFSLSLTESTFSADSLTVSVHPRAQSTHELFIICVHGKDPVVPCQSSVDDGNTKTPSMHRMLCSSTLSQLAFPGESNPNFPWEKSNGII